MNNNESMGFIIHTLDKMLENTHFTSKVGKLISCVTSNTTFLITIYSRTTTNEKIIEEMFAVKDYHELVRCVDKFLNDKYCEHLKLEEQLKKKEQQTKLLYLYKEFFDKLNLELDANDYYSGSGIGPDLITIMSEDMKYLIRKIKELEDED